MTKQNKTTTLSKTALRCLDETYTRVMQQVETLRKLEQEREIVKKASKAKKAAADEARKENFNEAAQSGAVELPILSENAAEK